MGENRTPDVQLVLRGSVVCGGGVVLPRNRMVRASMVGSMEVVLMSGVVRHYEIPILGGRSRPMKPRPRKYKTADGDYLVIDERGRDYDWYRLVWYIREWQDYGGIVGDTIPGEVAPKDREEWEVWQAARSVRALADGRDHDGYYFASKSKARAALLAANAGLLSGEVPWPEWALLAKAAGWTPPEGWKP